MKKMMQFCAVLAGVSLLVSACSGTASKPDQKAPIKGETTMQESATNPGVTDPASVQQTAEVIKPLVYPSNAVKTLSQRMISLSSFCDRGAGESNYRGNRHYTGTNLVISPYFTATVEEKELPVYATPVYVATGDRGVLHSFASVDVEFGGHEMISINLNVSDSVTVSSAQVFAHNEAILTQNGSELTLKVSKHGNYTIVLNDEQDHAITVFVRSYEDEDAQIAAYKAQYGDENVLVFEPGIHEISYLQMLSDNMVIYLKAGAILLPKHTIDVMDDEAAASAEENGARECNAIGLNRYPVINGFDSSNLTIAGRGTVDMTQLDWHERRGIVFTLCSNVTVDGVILINPCEWAFITYRCENVRVTQSAVLGYRTNSDAFAICNSIDVEVTDCFARTGDDMFEVKTLGGVDTAVSKDITYRRCQAWGSKARCFGVIGEIEKDVSNILFEDGIVIFRDAIWDNNRIGSLIVLRESGSGNVSGVTFRNIQIHFDAGRAINVGVYTNSLQEGTMTNIKFENVTYNAGMSAQLQKKLGARFVVILDRVIANGVLVNSQNWENHFYCDAEKMLRFM